ncbi:hypothetical protein CRE_05252 [Caenorhabditis remanei]|uniref:Sdz-33 F-box domain-containing protein n=1 Tax=Caenorhabditis remanei TaxID=31234 RepID=E3NID7_CAERE|nr:hypothetical protein CRE_05252 [Caenorhabditis remanei]
MSPFPLLRLHGVVLCEVFKSLSIGEKIKLSLSSKKVSIQINMARLYSQKVIVDLDCSKQKIEVRSENDGDAFDIFICPDFGKTLSSNTQQVSIALTCYTLRVTSNREEIKTFWKNNQKEGYISVIRHLLKMFQCRISTYSDLFQPTISMLFDLQAEFKMLYIRPKGSEDENLLWNKISSNLELVECLISYSSVVPDFRPVFNSWPQEISIWCSDWFTLDSLLACPCTTITLYHSHLENKDLDEVLKKWTSGGFPNLERLEIYSQNFKNNGTTILGMNFRELHGIVIQTDDGFKTAIIKLGPDSIQMSVFPFQ